MKVINFETRQLGKAVFCIPGLGRLDDCAALIVADSLKRAGFNARISDADKEIEAGNADNTICACFVEEVSDARMAYTIRKLSRKAASANVIVCRFGNEMNDERSKSGSGDISPRTLEEVIVAVGKTPISRNSRQR